jgi:hypothetical protein
MRIFAAIATAALVLMGAQVLAAQTRMKPTVPGTAGDPKWQGVIRTQDGRTFVTDGGLVIDAALAKPSSLPERTFPEKLLHDYFSLPHKNECGLGDLHAAASGKTYTSPNGLALNATYQLPSPRPPGALGAPAHGRRAATDHRHS